MPTRAEYSKKCSCRRWEASEAEKTTESPLLRLEGSMLVSQQSPSVKVRIGDFIRNRQNWPVLRQNTRKLRRNLPLIQCLKATVPTRQPAIRPLGYGRYGQAQLVCHALQPGGELRE
mgnify:CR=1 FL=1